MFDVDLWVCCHPRKGCEFKLLGFVISIGLLLGSEVVSKGVGVLILYLYSGLGFVGIFDI